MKIGILAFGETGSMIAEQAANRGFSVVAVNTAKLDFEKIKLVPKDCRIHLDGWEGAGGNREEGKLAVVSFADVISDKAQQKLSDCDFVFVAGSGSGGTGSGGIPVGTEILFDVKNFVGVITTFPETSESTKAQMNALECFSELSQFDKLGSIFIIDNEKIKNNFPSLSRRQRYLQSNLQFIESIAEIALLTKQKSYVSNFDRNDFLQILNERGCSTVSKIVIPVNEIKSEADFSEIIHRSWAQNYQPDFDKQVIRAAILGKMPEQITNFINIESIFSNVGMPYDVMEAYYSNEGNENHCVIYTILSGLAFPDKRINQMATISKDSEDKISKQIETARTQKFDSNNWTNKFARDKGEKPQKESLTERMAKFK